MRSYYDKLANFYDQKLVMLEQVRVLGAGVLQLCALIVPFVS